LGRLFKSKPTGVEQVLFNMAEQKRQLNQDLLDLLK
jgi:ATP phosphoribosyltransferase regulatory subunit HisZ